MIFEETGLAGAYLIKIEKICDQRGYFARTFCREELKAHGLNDNIVQCSLSFNEKKGTLRGMHFQKKPCEEDKMVQCLKGAVYDVIIDLRKDSPTFLKWQGFCLNEENRHILYIPKGFAHGFKTLEDKTELFYQMTEFYNPEASAGIRFDDPLFGIKWPESRDLIISGRDSSYEDYVML